MKIKMTTGSILALVLTAVVLVLSIWFVMAMVVPSRNGEISEILQNTPEARTTSVPDAPKTTEKARITPIPAPQKTSSKEADGDGKPLRTETVSIVCGGTIAIPKAIRDSAVTPIRTFDFDRIFDGVRPLFEQGDLSMVTLETLATGSPFKADRINAPVSLLDTLAGMGIDLVSLATERGLDKGAQALEVTRIALMERGIMAAGVTEIQGQPEESLMNVGSLRVAVLAYTYPISEEGLAASKNHPEQELCMLDLDRVLEDIRRVKNGGAQAVIVLPHWGTKNRPEMPQEIRKMAIAMAQAGADLILGSHPNVVGGTERLKVRRANGLEYETLVCYSLGALMLDGRTLDNCASAIVSVPLSYHPEERRVTVGEAKFTPAYIFPDESSGRPRWRVINPLDLEQMEKLSEAQQEKAREAVRLVQERVLSPGVDGMEQSNETDQ